MLARAFACNPGDGYPITVTYFGGLNATIKPLLEEGRYCRSTGDYLHLDFPHTKVGTEEAILEPVFFPLAQKQQALDELLRRGMRAANVAEILAFGIKYPDEVTKWPILALGRPGDDMLKIARRGSGDPRLVLQDCGRNWLGQCLVMGARYSRNLANAA